MALGSSKPVCYYQFENNANDTSNAGNGMNGTLGSPGTFSTTEKIRGSYAYKGGSAARVHSLGSVSDIGFMMTGVWTISWWTKLISTANQWVMGTNAASGGKDWDIEYSASRIRMKIYGLIGDTDVDYYSSTNPGDGGFNDTSDWHHLVVTSDTDYLYWYCDGVADTPDAVPHTWPGANNSSCALMLGNMPYTTCTSNTAHQSMTGYMDEVSFWNQTATADDVASLYNGGSPYDLSDGLQGGLPSGIKNVGGVVGGSVKMIGGAEAGSVKTIMGVS